jgi:hypothetical protein
MTPEARIVLTTCLSILSLLGVSFGVGAIVGLRLAREIYSAARRRR